MPSPLNGLIEPAASPTTSHVGPDLRVRPTRAIGRRPAGGRRRAATRDRWPSAPAAVLAHSRMRWRRVDALAVAERRQQADADVDGARRPPGRSSRSRATSCRCGRARRGRYSIHGSSWQWALEVARGWPCPGVAPVAPVPSARPNREFDAVGDDHVAGVDLPVVATVAGRCTTAPRQESVAQDRADRLGALAQDGAAAHGVLGDHRVEVARGGRRSRSSGDRGARATASRG